MRTGISIVSDVNKVFDVWRKHFLVLGSQEQCRNANQLKLLTGNWLNLKKKNVSEVLAKENGGSGWRKVRGNQILEKPTSALLTPLLRPRNLSTDHVTTTARGTCLSWSARCVPGTGLRFNHLIESSQKTWAVHIFSLTIRWPKKRCRHQPKISQLLTGTN